MKKLGSLARWIRQVLFGSYVRTFISYYAGFTLIGTLLLMLPISLKDADMIPLTFIDALFISASGMSTTGLSPVNISETLSIFGQVILALIIQVGGVGIMLMIAGFWVFTGRRITFRERTLIMTDQNQINMNGVIKLVRDMAIILFCIEFTGFLLLGTHFYYAGYFSFEESYFQAFFLAISMTTNAGFDITGTSLVDYSNDYYVQVVSMFLMFSGAVGFWALVETKDWLKAKLGNERFEFSIYVKLIVSMHIVMTIIGALFIIIFEFNHFFYDKGLVESLFYSLFMSLTTRNSGFQTMDVSAFQPVTHMLFNAFMFIGSSPNSAGGGIRTTTFIVVSLAIVSFAKGKDQVTLSGRSIKLKTIFKSFIVLVSAACIVFTSTLLLSLTESKEIHVILFEVCSAFGTTGLSLGITSELSDIGKIIIIMTMFIGRIGIIALLLSFKKKGGHYNGVRYPEMDLIIG
ncbi:TrkH family potassium uptake protein [Haloplasma contractile]|uniref:Ktr system potassium uptake protein D n=1 Tax=Haloplasma contractile SSD-17B TaxID=1033810 RepID=U2DXP6_9MOLU|nr:potassium transporter TrkG [Haloplasma contractile]ERJ13022.1 Ktr system potassium uptake protein D [Haloplasma contractile SSD-17B]